MQLLYETDRLYLAVCGEEQAAQILRFITENRAAFEPWEPLHSPLFYTEEYQRRTLRAEFKQTLQACHVRYYLSLKSSPEEIMGTVSFSHIHNIDDKSCKLGYKIAYSHQRQGYAREALSFLLPVFGKEQELHRIEADIMPANTASLRLIESLGFSCEGIARSSHEVRGRWEDHARYAFILDDTQDGG